jgi:hypothetical protein
MSSGQYFSSIHFREQVNKHITSKNNWICYNFVNKNFVIKQRYYNDLLSIDSGEGVLKTEDSQIKMLPLRYLCKVAHWSMFSVSLKMICCKLLTVVYYGIDSCTVITLAWNIKHDKVTDYYGNRHIQYLSHERFWELLVSTR